MANISKLLDTNGNEKKKKTYKTFPEWQRRLDGRTFRCNGNRDGSFR